VITDVPGVSVGHWTDPDARTGCTVVLLPEGTVGSGEVRGGAPATREFDLLAPGRLVERVDAVLLAGGSAFGLAAAEGVMRWCEERGRGFPTGGGVVPIVVAMALFDLTTGDGSVRPASAEGYAACAAASGEPPALGPVGAGAGATVGNVTGDPRPGGVGSASVRDGALVVSALAAVNAFGDVLAAGAEPGPVPIAIASASGLESTTLVVVATNAVLSKTDCLTIAQGGHDGLARALDPPHTLYDGDAVVAVATGAVEAAPVVVRALAVRAVAAAVRAAVPAEADGVDG
jgi:L-aminopeptidase/D-esterase-like protein